MEIISLYSIVPLTGSVLIFVLGLFVWLKKPNDSLYVIFFLFDFAISVWLFGTFMLFNAANEVDQIFWDRFIYLGVILVPILVYHFGLVYCGITKQRFQLVVGYLLAFIFLPLSQWSNQFVGGLYKYDWGVHAKAHLYHHFFLIYFFYFPIFFIYNLIKFYKKSTGTIRKQVKFVLFGFLVLIICGPLAFLPAYGIPIYPVVFFSGIAFVGIISYAIIRYNALDVRMISTEVITSLVNIVAIGQIFFSHSTVETILRVIAGALTFTLSYILILSVQKEVTRREQMTSLADTLAKANIQLKELDNQKTDFLSIAAHQLRTPLSIAKGYLELLEEDAYGKVTGETKQVLKNMDESNSRLVDLVDSFLDITRLEQGRTKYDFIEKDLNLTIDSVVKELFDRADQKGLSISWHPDPDLPKPYFDEEKIRHVVFNFIDNAIKYSDFGTIKVEAYADKNGVGLKVKDNGIGFDKVDEASFFQKFYRGNNVKGINVNGTGLGLFVCSKFIEAHHGKVWAHSEGPGKGGEFGFWIPVAASG